LGIPVEMVQFLLKLLETKNSCCVPRFPLSASCNKTADSQTWFTLYQGVRVASRSRCRSRKFWEGRSRTFYLSLRNPVV